MLALTAISGPDSARAQIRVSSIRLGNATVPLNDRKQVALSYLPKERPRFGNVAWA